MRILSVDLGEPLDPPPPASMVNLRFDHVEFPGGDGTRGPAPFRPFTLEPHEERFLRLYFRFGPCESMNAGGGATVVDYRVRYSVLGVEHETRIPLRSQFRTIRKHGEPCEG